MVIIIIIECECPFSASFDDETDNYDCLPLVSESM